MIDERDILERALRAFEPQPGLTDRVYRRRERKRRNQRIGAGALAIILALVSFVALTRAFRSPERPADEPTPRPASASLGALAYAVDGDIFVAEWDGSNPVRIADGRPPSDCGTGSSDGTGEYLAFGPIWSPDGRYLAYRHSDCDGPGDGWWEVVISDPQGNVVTSFPSEGWGISWSPDSSRVAVWVRWEEGTIGIYGLDGVRQTLLSVPPNVRRGETDPEWSPDSGSLLIGDGEVPIDGRPPWILPYPEWETYSPDGSRVAYTTRRSLVIAAPDGSNPQEMFGDCPCGSVVWSPTGDRIAFISFVSTPYASNNQLRVLDVATGTVTLLTETEGSDMLLVIAGGMFEFSSGGDRILFSRTKDEGVGASSLWSINADGSDLRRLVSGTAFGDWLSPTQIG